MLGLAVLFVMGIYFVFLVFITRICYKKAKVKWNKTSYALLSGIGGFLLVTLPVFWDVIPNKILFDRLCKNETQLQIYKTFDEWNAENPGVLETLVPFSYGEKDKKEEDPNYRDRTIDGIPYSVRYANQRIAFYWSSPYFQKLPFHVKRVSYLLFDIEKNEIMAKTSRIVSGPGNVLELGGDSYKIWLNRECKNDETNSMWDYVRKFKIFKKN